jgi:hypothetical protein
MNLLIIIIILVCCCCCILSSCSYYFTQQNNNTQLAPTSGNNTQSVPTSGNNTQSAPTSGNNTQSASTSDSNTSTPVTINAPSTTMKSTTTTTTTTTPKPKGITIYSEPDFQGKSLFLVSNNTGDVTKYDKIYFDKNWSNTGIGSWKGTTGDEFMINFSAKGASGGSANVNLKNMGQIFGGPNMDKFILTEINNFTIFTPSQYKKFWCKETGSKTYNSHFSNFPTSDC